MAKQVKQEINNYDRNTGGYTLDNLTPEQLAVGNKFISRFTNINSPGIIEKAPSEFGKSRYDKDIDLIYSPDINQQYTDLERLRGEEQSGLTQFGAMLNQAVIGEIIGGTIQDIGYIGDLGMTVS